MAIVDILQQFTRFTSMLYIMITCSFLYFVHWKHGDLRQVHYYALQFAGINLCLSRGDE